MNAFKCSTVLLSTQILIFAIAPISFISFSILCEFAMLPDVYTLLSPQEEEMHSSSWGGQIANSKMLVCKDVYSVKSLKTYTVRGKMGK